VPAGLRKDFIMKNRFLVLSFAVVSCLLACTQSNAWWGHYGWGPGRELGPVWDGWGWGGPVYGTLGAAADIATLGAVSHSHHRAMVDDAYEQGRQDALADIANNKGPIKDNTNFTGDVKGN
jgi:hypothetical protein